MLIVIELSLTWMGIWSLLSVEYNILVTACIWLAAGAVRLWNLFDAHQCARGANPGNFEAERRQIKDAWLALFLADLIPGLGQMYVKKWFCGAVFMAVSVPLLLIVLIGMKYRLLSCGLWAVFSALVCCHAYISASTRREQSNKAVSVVSAVILCSCLLDGCFSLAFKAYVVEAFRIPGETMKPTLIPGDRLLVRKNRRYIPKRGDVVVFKSTNAVPYVRRVAALPDETVEITDELLFINGRKVRYRPIKSIEHFNEGFGLEEPYKIGANHIFLIGDNATISNDSRSFGAIPVSDVIGKAYEIYWPFGRIGPIE